MTKRLTYARLLVLAYFLFSILIITALVILVDIITAIAIGCLLNSVILILMILESRERYKRSLEITAELIKKDFERQLENAYQQTDRVTNLMHAIKPRFIFPPMRGWAASPDFLCYMYEIIYQHNMKVIVEASSGVSSLVCGYALARFGPAGHVYSLEQDEMYAKKSAEYVQRHGLEEYVTIIHAPLVPFDCDDKELMWYNISGITDLKKIDFLVIDGPPSVQTMARYPAIPVLRKKLHKGSMILIDDASRSAEQEVIAAWIKEFPELKLQKLDAEKGAALLVVTS